MEKIIQTNSKSTTLKFPNNGFWSVNREEKLKTLAALLGNYNKVGRELDPVSFGNYEEEFYDLIYRASSHMRANIIKNADESNF